VQSRGSYVDAALDQNTQATLQAAIPLFHRALLTADIPQLDWTNEVEVWLKMTGLILLTDLMRACSCLKSTAVRMSPYPLNGAVISQTRS
jgi:hypothetical protein